MATLGRSGGTMVVCGSVCSRGFRTPSVAGTVASVMALYLLLCAPPLPHAAPVPTDGGHVEQPAARCLSLHDSVAGRRPLTVFVKKQRGGLGLKLRPQGGWILVTATPSVSSRGDTIEAGDAIVAVNGHSTLNASMSAFVDHLRAVQVGQEAQLSVLRDSVVTLTAQETLYEVALLKGKRGLGAGFGTDWKRDMPLDSFQGLFVAELVAGGLAAQAGCVLPGDRLVQVNRELRQSGHRRPHMSHLVASVRDTPVGSTVYLLLERREGGVAGKGRKDAPPEPEAGPMPGTRRATSDGSTEGSAGGDGDAPAAGSGGAGATKDEKIIVADLRRTSGRHSLGIQLALTNGRVTVASVKPRSPAAVGGVKEGDIIAGIGMSSRDMKTVMPGDSVQDVFRLVQSLRGRTVVLWLERLPSLADKLGKQRARAEAEKQRREQEARDRGTTVQFRRPGHPHPRWGALAERRFPDGAVSYEVELRKLSNGIGLSLATSKHKRNGRRQLLVYEIVHKSPAALSEVIRVDDVLTAIDRRVLSANQQTMPSVASILGQYPVGSMILFTFFRYPGGSQHLQQEAEADEGEEFVERMELVECEATVGNRTSGFRCLLAKFGPMMPVTAPMQVSLLFPKDTTGCRMSSKDKDKMKALQKRKLPVAVLVQRGTCFFHQKAMQAQSLGAVALIVANTQRRPAEVMTTPLKGPESRAGVHVRIPCVMVSAKDGVWLSQSLADPALGDTMTVSLYTPARHSSTFKHAYNMGASFAGGTFQLKYGRVGGPRHNHGSPPRPTDVPLRMTLLEAAIGKTYNLTYRRRAVCPVCHGKGGVAPHLHTCPLCTREHTHPHKWADIDPNSVGPGMLTWKSKLSGNMSQSRTQTCHVCSGFGQIVEKGHECGRCLGDRMVVEDVPVELTVPIGVVDGYSRRFPKLGSSTLSNPSPSDLVVRVKVATPAGFSREGADVLTSVNITIEEAAHGFTRNVTNYDGKWHMLVKRGVTFTGDEVVFSGEGMPLELDLEETMDFLQREANYSECVEFWTIAAELNATVDGNQEVDGDSGKEPASAAGADASRDDAKAASTGQGTPDASGEGSKTSAAGTEAEEGDLKPDREAEGDLQPDHEAEEGDPKAGDEGSFAQRLLQRCGEQPTLDKGDLRVAIIVSAAARPNVASPEAAADNDPATSTAKAQHFFDNFVNK